jgi:DNA-directed RNA polymerase specialized sigma24 family protein
MTTPADDGSVTRWIGDLKAGDPAALEALWARYFGRLAALARQRLRASGAQPGFGDEEDAALSALNSLWDRASGGRLEGLRGRDELWRLMVVITARKAIRQVEGQRRLKRGGGRVLNEAALAAAAASGSAGGDEADALARVAGGEPTPEFVALVAEEFSRRLEALPDPSLRQVALWRMEGWSNEEIAAKLGCVVRTVERKLDLIRKLWREEPAS